MEEHSLIDVFGKRVTRPVKVPVDSRYIFVSLNLYIDGVYLICQHQGKVVVFCRNGHEESIASTSKELFEGAKMVTLQRLDVEQALLLLLFHRLSSTGIHSLSDLEISIRSVVKCFCRPDFRHLS